MQHCQVKVSVLQFKFHPFTNFQVRFWTLPDNDALQGHTIKLLVNISLTRGSSMFYYLNSCLVSASPVMTLLHVSSFKVLTKVKHIRLMKSALNMLSVWWPYSKQTKKSTVLYQGIKESVLRQHLWIVLYDLLEALFCVHPEGNLFEHSQTQTLLPENTQELQSWLILSWIGRISGFSCPNSDNVVASSSKKENCVILYSP